MTVHNNKIPEISNRQIVAKSQIFEVERMDVAFGNGQKSEFERLVSRKPSVMVLPFMDPETVILVREFGVGLDRYEVALPKGLVDPGEVLLDAANREIKEEIGYGARSLVGMGPMALSPCYMSHQTDFVLAWDLYPEKLPGDEPEPLEPIFLKRNQIFDWVTARKIEDVRTLAALFMWTSGYLDAFMKA